jgi:putative IMPACT (imprinted ancient) family translation regulator
VLLPDSYTTIASNHSAEIKEKSSRFIAFAFPVTTDEQAKKQLADFKK